MVGIANYSLLDPARIHELPKVSLPTEPRHELLAITKKVIEGNKLPYVGVPRIAQEFCHQPNPPGIVITAYDGLDLSDGEPVIPHEVGNCIIVTHVEEH